MSNINQNLENILQEYQKSFEEKVFNDGNSEHDLLMDVFNLTPELKAENMQYWGRELGTCWQKLVVEICKIHCPNFQPALKIGNDEPCDLIVDYYAIDTKYRIGSGDSKTLKGFKQDGNKLRDLGYIPVILILRNDNLSAAITACKTGNWHIYTGDDTFSFIQQISGFDLKQFLMNIKAKFAVVR